jgi:rare lipoprotein A
MWWWRAGLAMALGVALAACSLIRPTTPPVIEGRQEGIASWYGPGFHGKRTANGEIYDQYELTAAHQTLPLGTRVMVTSLTNGRSVEVRINDRGPFIDGRIVDLSYAAASVIRMVGPGTMPVRVEVLDAPVQIASRTTVPVTTTPPASRRPPPERTVRDAEPLERRDVESPPAPAIVPSVPAEPPGSYAVLVATLSDAGMAEHLRSRIAIKFADAHVSPLDAGMGRYYRVRIGPYPNRGVAVAQAALVNRYGYPAVITDESRP